MIKNKFLTLVLSFIPGVGHLYLGQMSRGIQILIAFSGTIFLINFLRLNELSIFLPVIWFYSVFDALHQNKLVNEGILEDAPIISWDTFMIRQRWVAYSFIGIGFYVLVNNILMNLSRYYNFLWNFNLNTILVSLILIFIGIRLLKPKNNRNGENPNEPI